MQTVINRLRKGVQRIRRRKTTPYRPSRPSRLKKNNNNNKLSQNMYSKFKPLLNLEISRLSGVTDNKHNRLLNTYTRLKNSPHFDNQVDMKAHLQAILPQLALANALKKTGQFSNYYISGAMKLSKEKAKNLLVRLKPSLKPPPFKRSSKVDYV